jgi:hypothetical protein
MYDTCILHHSCICGGLFLLPVVSIVPVCSLCRGPCSNPVCVCSPQPPPAAARISCILRWLGHRLQGCWRGYLENAITSGPLCTRTHCIHVGCKEVGPRHICTGTRLAPATSAPGLGSPPPHLHPDLARPRHICTGTRLAPATSAPGLGSPPPHLPGTALAAHGQPELPDTDSVSGNGPKRERRKRDRA